MPYGQSHTATPPISRAANASTSRLGFTSQQTMPRNSRFSRQDSPAWAPSTALTQIGSGQTRRRNVNARSMIEPRPSPPTDTTVRRRDSAGQTTFRNLREAEVSGGVFVNTPGPVNFYHEGVSSNHPTDNDGIGALGTEVNIHPTHHYGSVIATPSEHSEYETYCKYLLVKKRGTPLWVPGPLMMFPTEYRRNGVSIGDVGILNPTTGDFTFLFNIFLSADHEINEGRVPNGFIPLDKSKVEKTMKKSIIPDRCLASSTLRRTDSFEFSFQTTAREGAVLVMPDGGLSEELQNYKLLDKYIAANIKSWWEYIESDDCGVPTENGIQVVVGADKVSSWGMATFENVEGPMHFEFKQDGAASQTQNYTWKCINGRAGPAEREIRDLLMGTNASPLCNQCVFVRTLNVSVTSKVRVQLAAHEVRISGQQNPNIQTSKARSPPGALHPSKLLNEYLLEKCPSAKVVITKDSDWISVITENDATMPSAEEICARILRSYLICGEQGVVTLKKRGEDFSTESISHPTIPEDVVMTNENDPYIIGHLYLENLDEPAEHENTTPHRQSTLAPVSASISLPKVEICHDSPTTTSIWCGSSAPTTSTINSPSLAMPNVVVARPSWMDIDFTPSSGSVGILSDTTITSEGFTDCLPGVSEEEVQRQAHAAVIVQNQMEEHNSKMARQPLSRVGPEPRSWIPPTGNPKDSYSSTRAELKVLKGHSKKVRNPCLPIKIRNLLGADDWPVQMGSGMQHQLSVQDLEHPVGIPSWDDTHSLHNTSFVAHGADDTYTSTVQMNDYGAYLTHQEPWTGPSQDDLGSG